MSHATALGAASRASPRTSREHGPAPRVAQVASAADVEHELVASRAQTDDERHEPEVRADQIADVDRDVVAIGHARLQPKSENAT